MSKKSLILVVSLVLALTVGLGGTLAFFTDRDSETNIFTVGNVDIDLNEDFEQGAELMPGVYIPKIPTITNEGSNDAYVWMTIAVPAAVENTDASKNVIHWNWLGGTCGYDNTTVPTMTQAKLDKYVESGWLPEDFDMAAVNENGDYWYGSGNDDNPYSYLGTQTINGVLCNVYVFKYANPLTPGEETVAGPLVNVYMDSNVDIDPEGNMYRVENGVATDLGYNVKELGNPKIYVAAYGIQAEGFKNVEEAYTAYMGQWGANGGVEYSAEQNIVPVTDVRPAGYVPAPDEGVIDNMIITDGSNDKTNLRALYNGEGGAANYLTKDLTINNSYFDGTYAMNLYAAEGAGVDFVANNTTFAGWTSYNEFFETVTFNGCTFKANTNPEIYNVVRPYKANTITFVDCEFSGTELWLDQLAGAKITLKDCTYNGEAITDASVFTVPHGEASSIVIE